MVNFQEAMARLLTPVASNPEIAGRPAIVQTASSARKTDERAVTYGELQDQIARVVFQYRRVGLAPGDAVLLCSPNSPELVAGIIAAWGVGAVAIPVDFRLTRAEVENIARRVQAKIVYTPGFALEGFTALSPAVFAQGEKAADGDLLSGLTPETPGLVILTSGTTGVPKGAVHNLGSLVSNVVEIGEVFGVVEGKSTWLPLPVSHIFGVEVTLALLVLYGSVIFAEFSPADFWPVIGRWQPYLVTAVPTIYGALLAMPHPGEVCKVVGHYLSGGAPLSESLSEQFEKAFGKRLVQGYGSTETKIITINKTGPVQSVGRAIPSVTVEIVGADEKPLPDGESGEIRVTGSCLMTGYLNQPEETAKVVHGNHYHTGDVGHIKDGWVFISGRSKEMINVAGNKVFPAEVESVLRKHPLALEVAVVGVPHKKLGQIVKAIIVVSPGELSDRLSGQDDERKAAQAELKLRCRDFCAANLKRELRPMEWEFRPASDPLPKTHTGKIDKKQLQPV